MIQLKSFETLLFAAALLVLKADSSKNYTIKFDVFASQRNSLVIAAEKAVDELNRIQSNASFIANWFDAYSKGTDLLSYGNLLLERNASITFQANAPEKLYFLIPNVLSIPLIGSWHQSCYKCSTASKAANRHTGSMMPKSVEQLNVIKQMAARMEWVYIGITYSDTRFSTVLVVADELRKAGISIGIAALTCKSNGTITPFSMKAIDAIYAAKPDAIVAIIDEAHTSHFFTFIDSESMKFRLMKLNIFIYDLIDQTNLVANHMHTVIALHADVKEDARVQSLRGALSPSDLNGRDISKYALMYDAVVVSGKVISDMIGKNQWNSTYGDLLQSGQERAERSTALFKNFQTLKETGLTGNIEFDAEGLRKNMPLKIMNLRSSVFQQIGTYDKDGKVTLQSLPKTNVDQGDNLKVNGHLRTVTILESPFISKQILSNGTAVYYGLIIDLFNEMSKIANFTYSLYEVADNSYGHQVNGKWVGMVGDVLNKKADIALAPITVTSAREAVVDFTKPFFGIKVAVVSQKPKPVLLDLLQFMMPFTITVWLMVLSACVFIGIMLFSVDYFSPFGWRQYGERKSGEEGTELNIGNSLWFSIQSILLQGADNTPRSLSGRILVGCFWFYVLILTSSYTANLAAFFTSEKAADSDTSLENLLKNGHEFTTIQNYALENYLRVSDYKVYNRIHERIVMQGNLANGTTDAIRRVRADERMYYLEELPYVKWMVNTDPCDLQVAETTIPETTWGLPVATGSPHAKAISYAISNLLDSGFIEERERYYEQQLFSCSSILSNPGITSDGRIEPLQMVGVYSFLIGGIIMSVLLMIGENWWKKKIEERAARVKARFMRGVRLRSFRMTKRNVSDSIRKFKVEPKHPHMSLVVTDLMKEVEDKRVLAEE